MAEKQFVKSDETGELVEVVPVRATAVSANVSATSTEFEKGDAAFIQAYMTSAVAWCHREGIVDPEQIKHYIQVGREQAKDHIRRAREQARKEAEIAANKAYREAMEKKAQEPK